MDLGHILDNVERLIEHGPPVAKTHDDNYIYCIYCRATAFDDADTVPHYDNCPWLALALSVGIADRHAVVIQRTQCSIGELVDPPGLGPG